MNRLPGLIGPLMFCLVIVLLAAGCGGTSSTPIESGLLVDVAEAPDTARTAGLPALSTLDSALAQTRGSAGLTETLILGKFTFLRSANAVENGTALQLSASAGSLEWGVYGLDLQGTALDSVSVALDVDDDSEAWIALADYSKGVWEWHGPLTAGKTLAVDEQRFLSPGGLLYCAVASSDGDTATVSALSVRSINPANIAPTADLQPNISSGDAPLQVSFDGGASSDSDGTIVEYAWDWDDDGLYEGISDQSFASHTFTTPGEWTVRLRVTDEQFARDSTTVAISVNVAGNELPSASFTPDRLFADQGSTVSFDGSLSDDNDGGLVKYEWDFDGDGQYDSYGAVPSASHAYSSCGSFSVQLRVTDTVGAQSSVSAALLINEVLELDGAWPGRGHDDRHTGRSPYVGSQTNSLKWDYTCGVGGVYSSPAIGADGTIYVGSHDSQLYAINPDGTLQWSYPAGNDIYSSPALGPDGTVYFGSFDGNLYALWPDGTLKWTYFVDTIVNSSPVVGSDGTIYVGTDFSGFIAVYPDGSLKWNYPTGNFVGSSPALGADGTIYVGSKDKKLHAINPDGTQKWAYTAAGFVQSSPAIGTDGTIYVGCDDSLLYAVFPDGGLKWTFPTGNQVNSSPALGADGTIYVGSSDNKLYAINPDGTQKWAYSAGDNVASTPAIDAAGTIFVGCGDSKLYAIKPDGTLKWSALTGGGLYSSPAIGADGTIYVGSQDNKLYAFGTPP